MSSQKWLSWSELELHINFPGNLTDPNHSPQFIISHYSVFKTNKYFVYIAQLDLDQFTKMINMFRVGTPQPFIFKNWIQWCITGLNLTPHFKFITILCCQNSDIIILDRPTRNISVHENYQHVQGWNTTIIFLRIVFFKNQKNGLKIDLDVCW